MANATYTAANYYSDHPIPACNHAGEIRVWGDSITSGGVIIADTDTFKFARIPANHTVLRFEIYVPDWDTGGTALAMDIGTTSNGDSLADAIVIGTAGYFAVPLNGATTGLVATFSDTAPTSDYDLLGDVTAGATTGSTGTAYFRVYYTVLPSVYDPTDSPSVVTS